MSCLRIAEYLACLRISEYHKSHDELRVGEMSALDDMTGAADTERTTEGKQRPAVDS